MNQYRISILVDAETKEQALINLAETIDQHQDLSGVFSVEHVFASEPPKRLINSAGYCSHCHTQSINYGIECGSYTYYCTKCDKKITSEEIERDESDLDPRLTPFYQSKQRVEITWKPGYEDYTGYGARTEGRKARGTIGKSTGWKPIYLLILTARSTGGGAILSSAIESVRAI